MSSAVSSTVPDDRQRRLQDWLAGLSSPAVQAGSLHLLAAAAGDAGLARRYRVQAADGQALLALDLPGAATRHAQASAALGATGVTVPAVLAQDGEDFLLTADPGPVLYAHQLNPDTATKLHLDALDALVLQQVRGAQGSLPELGRTALLHELKLFPEWYVGKHLGETLDAKQAEALDKVFDALLAVVAAQAPVLLHGDFRPQNLVVQTIGNPAMLGLQEAAFGPILLDVVTLLRDPGQQWDEELVLDWAIRYWERAKRAGLPVAPDIDGFYQEFEFTGLLRHLGQLGRAARAWHRDGHDGLLADIPALLAYAQKTAFRYRPLLPLVRLLEDLEDKAPQVGYTF